jgi:hypothetical protein
VNQLVHLSGNIALIEHVDWLSWAMLNRNFVWVRHIGGAMAFSGEPALYLETI